MKGKVEHIAKKIISSANVTDPECGSILLVLTIVGVILNLIRVIQECNKKEASTLCESDICGLYQQEIKTLSLRSGWYTKMRIKKLLRKELSSKDYEKFGLSLVAAIMDAGANIGMEDTLTLIEATNA